MLSLPDTLNQQISGAVHKDHASRDTGRYLVAAILAGAFIGIADVFMFTAAGPLAADNIPWAPLVGGLVFGLGLILVVFAGSELVTSAMMVVPIGWAKRSISIPAGLRAIGLMIIGNLVGSIIIALLIKGSGIMDHGPVADYMATVSQAKVHKPTGELFFRGIMCNVLVCLAVWTQTRATNEVAKMVVMAWCMAAFVTSGFEHVVANMTTLSLGLVHGVDTVTLAGAARNLVVVLLGNAVGGAVFVALPYLASVKQPAAAPADTAGSVA
ncbi:formate/nitrite transporter family protein [Corynebacterium mendelii]|uniref:Formate/nitrite transporter family protein n=1 Tax=Corynebacterium mendelii TaxID=2765362 RepID=A0A939E0N2_9CORY|nr:formate/nitrite transporter family protein [Corynebacterium mendelii]MBN9644785.1 formate/nitrite transporter family protein [Corynebacterium mendelii]